ncbi:MAG: YhjD/YihY/BrkB family envelope integrity protein [Microlunatus sp.]
MSWREKFQILKRSWTRTQADQIPLLGAGVAFYGFLALFPTLIALVLAYGLFADPSTIAAQVEALGSALPPDVKNLIIEQITERSRQTGALSIGVIIALLVALWGASGGVANLVQAINAAYHQTDDRGLVKKRALALALTAGAIAFMIILVSLVAVLPVVFSIFDGGPLRWLIQIARWVLIAGLIMVALAVLYRFAPDQPNAELVWTSPGAIVATLVWLAVSAGFSLYVTLFASYAKTYGALAGIVVLLMWLWLTSYAVLFGAEINAEAEREASGQAPAAGQPEAADADAAPAEDPLEAEIATTRARLGADVSELVAKADLKGQAEVRARQALDEAQAKAARSPGTVAAVSAGAGFLIGLLVRRRR